MKFNVKSDYNIAPKENDFVMVNNRLHIAKELPEGKFTLLCLEGRDNTFYGKFNSFRELAEWFEDKKINVIVFSLDAYEIEINVEPK